VGFDAPGTRLPGDRAGRVWGTWLGVMCALAEGEGVASSAGMLPRNEADLQCGLVEISRTSLLDESDFKSNAVAID
jgi:hypothetical protein